MAVERHPGRLGTLGGNSETFFVSNDGTVVAGNSALDHTSVPVSHAFRWTDGSMVDIQTGLVDGNNSSVLGATAVQLNGSVTRGYLDGSAAVTSTGTTTGNGYGALAQLGFAFGTKTTSVTPYLSATLSSVSYAGWTETDGPAPAVFSDMTSTRVTYRVGLEARQDIGTGALTAGIALAHRDGSASPITGDLPGLIALSVPGDTTAPDLVELSAGLSLPVGDHLVLTSNITGLIPLAGASSYLARMGANYAF